MKSLVVFGDRTAQEVLEAAQLSLREEFQTIKKLYFADSFATRDAAEIESNGGQVFFNVGVANTELKQRVVQAACARGWTPQTIVHPTSFVSPSASIGQGTFVGPLAVVSADAKIGAHCLIHIHCTVGHDDSIADYSAVLPGARISGNVLIGSATIIGSNAFIAPNKSVGARCRVDALTHVSRDLADDHILSCRSPTPIRRFLT